ncbi:MAG: DUF1501 domain-containing protein [Sphingobacteriaceae bacterium]|nr:DUF1501 domain-containing protein [Sphingobacteriaceae bacterium]
MKRRTFLKTSTLASAGLFLPSLLRSGNFLFPQKTTKKLILIHLNGGNDWLNTIIPFKNELYYKFRPKIAIPTDQVIPLTGTLGLHPALKTLKELYAQKEMCIVNNVGYPNPDRSHFRSSDIWHSAGDSNEYISTGWLGRYMDLHCTNAYEAVQGDLNLSLALKGNNLNGVAIKNLKHLHTELQLPLYDNLIKSVKVDELNNDNQSYLYKTLIQTHTAFDYVFEKNKLVQNNKEYPKGGFGTQLKNAASLIAAESDIKIFFMSINGFDTHMGQLKRQEKLLTNFSEGISTFIENLKELNKWDDTLIMTYSEFGRRAEENANAGTDHGTAGNVLLFGKNLKKTGIVNEDPDLENLLDGDLKHSIDFRSIYKNVLQNWMQVDADAIIPQKVKGLELI